MIILNNVLTIAELQYLDVLLKNITYRAKSKKILRLVIKDGSLLLTGDFFLYKKHSPIKLTAHLGEIEEDSLHSFPFKAVKEILQPYDEQSGTTNSAILAVANPSVLMETILNCNVPSLVKNIPWENTTGEDHNFPPFLYYPEFLNQIDFNALPFYVLDAHKSYEVVSLVSIDS